MATRPSHSVANLLNAAQLAISNTLGDAEIQGLVAAYGYSAARLHEGQQLHETAVRATNAQAAAAGAQREATAGVKAAEQEARDAYQALAQVARAALRLDKARLAILGIVGPMPKSTASFLAAAYLLFDNALAVTEMRDRWRNTATIRPGCKVNGPRSSPSTRPTRPRRPPRAQRSRPPAIRKQP